MKPEEFAKHLADNVRIAMKNTSEDIRKEFEDRFCELQAMVQSNFDSMPLAEKGEKGDAGIVDMDEIRILIDKAVSNIQLPKGEKGEKGDPGIVDMEKVWELIVEEFKKVELPPPEKGEKGEQGNPGEVDIGKLRAIISEEIEKSDIPRPKALQDEEIEDGINERRSYPRGTIARHRGGLWRAHQRTSGMRGWECLVAGINDINIEFDGERDIKITIEKSEGASEIKNVYIPAMLYKEVYRDEQQYFKNDYVTLSGSLWVALNDTKGRPGLSDDWRLAAKRGGTGKSAYDLARDAGFKGTKQEWLDSLGKKPTVKI